MHHLATLSCRSCLDTNLTPQFSVKLYVKSDGAVHLHVECDKHGQIYCAPVTLDHRDVCHTCLKPLTDGCECVHEEVSPPTSTH